METDETPAIEISEAEVEAIAELYINDSYMLKNPQYLNTRDRIALGIHIWRRNVKGETLREIAQTMGISHPSAHRYKELAAQAINPTGVETARKLAIERCERMIARWQPLAEDTSDLEKAERASKQLVNWTNQMNKLTGADAAVKVEMQVAEVTQADLELQSMLREAEAKVRADEARIRGESS